MKEQLFISLIISALSFATPENVSWHEILDSRYDVFQDDQVKSINISFSDLVASYYNLTQEMDNLYKDFDNHTIQLNCKVTNLATKCSNVDIFEAVEVLPSTTEYLEITDSPVQILRHSILSNLTSLIHLKLTNDSIQFITSKLFIGLGNLRNLNLSDNNIRSLTKVAFSGCLKLESLDLSRNRIISLMFIPALERLHNFTCLLLMGNNIRRIKQNDLSVLNSSPLKSLDFSFCGNLSLVERGSFGHLRNLEILVLKVTYLNETSLANITYSLPSIKSLGLRFLPALRTFPTESMFYLTNSSVEFIDFGFTDFSFIPSRSFPELPTLKTLNFHFSSISDIENGAFDGLKYLKTLDLYSNRLSEIPTSISALKNLETLNLAKQKTEKFKIPDYSLSNLTSLTVMRLDQNPIKSTLSKFALAGLSNLTHLIMISCEIVNIEPGAFESLPSLEFLELSYNNIFGLSNRTLNGLHRLKTLALRNNGLYLGYNTSPFSQTKSLQKLLLQNNNLRALKQGLFSKMAHLKVLNLTKNEIIPWDTSIFEGISPETVLLKDNKIRYATPAMLTDFEKVVHVDVSSNPFDCHHCQIDELREWLLRVNDTYAQIEDNVAYSCFSPPDLNGLSIFEIDLQLDHCFPPLFALEIRMAIGFSAFIVFITIFTVIGYYFRWYFRYWWFHIHASVKRLSTSSDKNAYLYEAFVSYNSADITWVTRILIPNLENRNSRIRLCLHDRDFEVGRLITENILESIDKSKKVLLVLTRSFVMSEWCLFELHVAQHRLFHDTRDAMVLIQLETLNKNEVSKHLRYLMKTRTLLVWPDAVEKQKAFWTNLHKILTS